MTHEKFLTQSRQDAKNFLKHYLNQVNNLT
jgi:hypothetical protein